MAKDTTEDTRNFSIFFLNQSKKLEPECSSYNNSIIWSRHDREIARINYDISTVTHDSYIRLDYKIKKSWETEWKLINYTITLEQIPCHFGGKRWFFRCPLVRNGQICGRRVAKLYQVGDLFGCRKCADLTYESCQESKKFSGFPWKTLTNVCKGHALYKKVKVEYYNGKPTRKYRRCLKLWGFRIEGTNTDEQLDNSYN